MKRAVYGLVYLVMMFVFGTQISFAVETSWVYIYKDKVFSVEKGKGYTYDYSSMEKIDVQNLNSVLISPLGTITSDDTVVLLNNKEINAIPILTTPMVGGISEVSPGEGGVYLYYNNMLYPATEPNNFANIIDATKKDGDILIYDLVCTSGSDIQITYNGVVITLPKMLQVITLPDYYSTHQYTYLRYGGKIYDLQGKDIPHLQIGKYGCSDALFSKFSVVTDTQQKNIIEYLDDSQKAKYRHFLKVPSKGTIINIPKPKTEGKLREIYLSTQGEILYMIDSSSSGRLYELNGVQISKNDLNMKTHQEDNEGKQYYSESIAGKDYVFYASNETPQILLTELQEFLQKNPNSISDQEKQDASLVVVTAIKDTNNQSEIIKRTTSVKTGSGGIFIISIILIVAGFLILYRKRLRL